MSRWKTNFDNQKAVERIQGCLAALKQIDTKELPRDVMQEYERLIKVLSLLTARLSKLDPDLFSYQTWSAVPGWLTSVANQITSFANTKNMAHLQAANASVDDFLNILRPLDIGPTVEEFKSIAEANHHVQQKYKEEIERAKTLGDQIKAQVDSLSSAIVQSKAKLDDNNKVIESQKDRLDKSIAEFQKQFSQSQEKRVRDFADSITAISQMCSTKISEFENQFKLEASQRRTDYEALLTKVQSQSETHLDFLRKRELDVNKIYGAIGATSLAGDFKFTAEQERKEANLWRWIAFSFMALMVAGAGVVLYYTFSQQSATSSSRDWLLVAIRYGTVIVLAVPALYAAKESSKHRERERQNRKIGLELASLDAYLVLLPEADRNKIKGTLTDKFFGVPSLAEQDEGVSQKDLLDLLSKAVDNVTKAK